MSQDFKKARGLSPEVQLAWEVMTCRALRSTYDAEDHPCHWFNNHYGPYPAYDWLEGLPGPGVQEEEQKEIPALCMGERFQVPELMSGCRKAPIMTIGINPNLTAYYPSVDGATWCYPYFENIAQYAYYFRHRAVCQEHFSVDFIRENIIPGSEIIAADAGKVVKTELSLETGGINLIIQYKDKPQQTLRLDRGYKILSSPYDPKGFAKGEKIAGKVQLKPNTQTTLYRQPVGYYKRFRTIFDTFKQLAGLQTLPLQMGEDVCQADMVACASPGWDKWFTNTALEGITRECVHKRKWLVLQLLQTNPAVIVFSGMSAFSMFYGLMKEYIHTALDLSSDTFELLKACITSDITLEIDMGKGQDPLRARVAISPHFSYDDNFKPQSRFTHEEWKKYAEQYPEAFKILEPKAVYNSDQTRRVIYMVGPDTPTEAQVGPEVWKILQEHLYNAGELIAHVMLSEYEKGRLQVAGEHFRRNEGHCKYCVNELFTFNEGCPYGKIGEDMARAQSILKVSAAILDLPGGK